MRVTSLSLSHFRNYERALIEPDAGVKRALPSRTPRELLKMAEAWRPWRSYATVNLWNTL